MTELHQLSATELLGHYARRSLAPVEVVRALLAHIERCEPQLHACYALDPAAALAAASASESRCISTSVRRCRTSAR